MWQQKPYTRFPMFEPNQYFVIFHMHSLYFNPTWFNDYLPIVVAHLRKFVCFSLNCWLWYRWYPPASRQYREGPRRSSCCKDVKHHCKCYKKCLANLGFKRQEYRVAPAKTCDDVVVPLKTWKKRRQIQQIPKKTWVWEETQIKTPKRDSNSWSPLFCVSADT